MLGLTPRGRLSAAVLLLESKRRRETGTNGRGTAALPRRGRFAGSHLMTARREVPLGLVPEPQAEPGLDLALHLQPGNHRGPRGPPVRARKSQGRRWAATCLYDPRGHRVSGRRPWNQAGRPVPKPPNSHSGGKPGCSVPAPPSPPEGAWDPQRYLRPGSGLRRNKERPGGARPEPVPREQRRRHRSAASGAPVHAPPRRAQACGAGRGWVRRAGTGAAEPGAEAFVPRRAPFGVSQTAFPFGPRLDAPLLPGRAGRRRRRRKRSLRSLLPARTAGRPADTGASSSE